jgi:16S rRNA (uracil1498-N3)-methyltransferase
MIDGGRTRLSPEARHYLYSVLRLRPGTRIEVFDGEDGLYQATLGPSSDELTLGDRTEVTSSSPVVWLAFALAKGEKNDLVMQKATELGVSRLLPWKASRSVTRLDGDRAIQRTRRWQRIVAEAARQSGRGDVPEVMPPMSLEDMLRSVPSELQRIVFSEEGGEPISELLRAPALGYLAVIGPEGGFEPSEIAACIETGCVPTTLGPRILRTETAAIVAVALLVLGR